MTCFRPLLTALVCLVLTLVVAVPASADERILNYDSDIRIARDGILTVTEAIKVRAEQNNIRQGIYRDFPLTARGAFGRQYRVGFKLLSVRQDGRPAPHFTRESGAGIRIYVGQEGVLVPVGIHTYEIRYETTRQIRFFDDHDELYWNVTGNEWIFPIDKALAQVTLPQGVDATDWTAYTGAFGDDGTDFRAGSANGGNRVDFETTSPLGPGEGLTVVVSMPPGSVDRPSEAEQRAAFFHDFRLDLIGGIGVLLVFVYYLVNWFRRGRDPAKGVIFPRFEPPEDVSPALANFIENRGFGNGWVALSAAAISLAVKKRLRLEESGGDTVLHLDKSGRQGADAGSGLPKGEAAIEKWLDGRGDALPLNKANGKSIQALGRKFQSAISREYGNVYFHSNSLLVLPGILMSALTIIAMFVFLDGTEDETGFMILFVFLSVFASIFSGVLGGLSTPSGRPVLRLTVMLFLLSFALGGAALLAHVVTGALGTLIALPITLWVLLALNIVFISFMGAPTHLGRKVLDKIEGLKLYLTVAEKERMNMAEAPDMSTVHFEKLLPYAVALGVEKPWAEAFESWPSSAAAGAATASAYSPGWYSGRSFDARHISDSVGRTASSMAGAFESSLPVTSSSSSGSSLR
ncbi:DUF2207 domain-containing protein, partial [Rhodobacterales bacterium]